MVRIRLTRTGSKFQPSYRIVVTDSRNPRDTRPLETIGWHNPRTRPQTDVVQEDRALYWLSVGAQPSDAAQNILTRNGTLARFERLKKGETIEALTAEALATAAPMPDQRTNYPAPEAGQGNPKFKK